jgi:hypothetical protein
MSQLALSGDQQPEKDMFQGIKTFFHARVMGQGVAAATIGQETAFMTAHINQETAFMTAHINKSGLLESAKIHQETARMTAQTQQQTAIGTTLMNLVAQAERDKAGQVFQKEILGLQQDFNQYLAEYNNDREDARLTRRQDHEWRIQQFNSQLQIILANLSYVRQGELAKGQADDTEERRAYALTTPQSVLNKFYQQLYQEAMRSEIRIPPLVVVSPVALQADEFPFHNANEGFLLAGKKAETILRDFLAESYSLQHPTRPLKYHGIDWRSKKFTSDAAMGVLNEILKPIPTLILEYVVEGDQIHHYVAWWDEMETYNYQKVFSFPWKKMLYPVAKRYAKRWGERRMELLNDPMFKLDLNGQPLTTSEFLEKLAKKGKNDEYNYRILEEEEKELRAGWWEEEHDYEYILNEDKYINELSELLGVCHCVLIGSMLDRYFLKKYGDAPIFPETFISLLSRCRNDDLKKMLIEFVQIFNRGIYEIL